MSTVPVPSADPREQITRRALAVWLTAVTVYISAIAGRTSFGVAGVEAMDRFGVDASRVAVFTAVQVGVYALSQIPVGLIIDKVGPRRMMVLGALIMAAGQVTLALTEMYAIAIVARVLIGAGDATAFLSAMRLLPAWFPIRTTPMFTQLTAGLGQLGQFLSAVPFLALLHGPGWTAAFLTLGSAGALVALAAAIAVSDTPDAPRRRAFRRPGATTPSENLGSGDSSGAAAPADRPGIGAMLGIVLRHPVCWQGFFTHWVGLLHQAVFTMLWGMPLMTLGMGLDPAEAGGVLVANTAATVLAGPLLGVASARFGARRMRLAFVLGLVLMGMWVWFLIPATPRGLVAVVLLNIGMAALTPMSNYGFDSVRENLDRRVLATGTGLSNMGGFVAAMIAAQGIGLLLDYSADGGTYDWGDFRFAWLALGAVWAAGFIGLLASRRAVWKSLEPMTTELK